MANKKITDLTAATTLNDDDLFPCVSGVGVSPVTEKITVADLKTVIGTGNTTIESLPSGGDFTQNPLSGNVIEFSDVASSGIQSGDLVSFVQNGQTNYYLVSSVAAQNNNVWHVTLAGPSISTAFAIGDITIYSKSRVLSSDLIFSGAYAINGTTQTLINRETKSKFRWNGAKAYLVYVVARNDQQDGTLASSINIRIAKANNLGTSNNVLTSAITLAGTGWQASSNTVDSGQYVVEFGDELEVSLVSAGTDGDSRDLTVTMVFGLEF